ncbi:MAG: FMN-binding protein [Candidatus Pacebacteria bacterium]|nr:FMN-binding protein [Candidatus Paceibacterota bacterium]
MKKFFTSAVFVLAFAGYGLYQSFANSGTTNYIASNAAPLTQSTDVVTLAQSSPPPTPTPEQTRTISPSTPKPTPISTPKPKGQYVDGTYPGSVVDVYYGNVQVKALISGGKLADVGFLQYPSDRSHSLDLSRYALPILKSEAIRAQSADVNIISGASDTSMGFQESLNSALSQAKS